jgi:hypothetical protein
MRTFIRAFHFSDVVLNKLQDMWDLEISKIYLKSGWPTPFSYLLSCWPTARNHI